VDDKLLAYEASLENLKRDLTFQLTFEHMNWDYFIDVARQAKSVEEWIDKLNGEN
jgi:hypothetical protein